MYIQTENISPGIKLVKISKPQTLNALNSELIRELDEKINVLTSEPDLRVIIITGEGKSFVAGADISEMKDMSLEEARAFSLLGARIFRKIEFSEKVTIAAINGYALGGGNELAMACDIRIASERARFGQPEVGLGIIPGFSGIRRIIELAGEGKAKEYIFSGRTFNAEEAEKAGLVNKVVGHDALMKEVYNLAKEIAAKSFNAIIAAKKVINALKTDIDEKIQSQSEIFAGCFNHHDQKTGMESFLKKEEPDFSIYPKSC